MWDYISDFDIFCWRSKNMLYFFVNRPWKRLSKNLLSIKRGFSKAYKYFVDIRKNKSNFLNLRKTTSPPLTLRVFSKTHQSSLTLKGGSTSHLGLLPSGEKRKPPYSVLKPLRYMDGGPSEVYASSGAAVFCAGMNPLSLKDLLKGCLLLCDSLDRWW